MQSSCSLFHTVDKRQEKSQEKSHPHYVCLHAFPFGLASFHQAPEVHTLKQHR